MKLKFSILIVGLLVINYNSFAKIWRVNNSAGINANFTQLQAAIQSTLVGNGDTIYVESSSATYDNVSDISKSLVIIGPGYFLSNWTTPVQYNLSPAKVSYISATSASNVKIMGLTIDYLYVTGNNFSVSRSNIGTLYFTQVAVNSINITQNWIQQVYNYYGYAATNVRIANNIFLYGFTMGASDNGLMEYNVFNTYGGQALNFSGGAFNFEKNIVAGTSGTISNYGNVLFKYNMCGFSGLPTTANGNQNNINMANNAVFVNNNYTANNDQYFMLSPTSPAKTAGPSSTAIGAYAGTAPYIASGIPPIPTIYDITIPQSTQTGSSVIIKFSSKSNN